MADAATMTIKAVLLPDEIQTTLKDLTFAYTPVNDDDKWFYGIINVPHNTGGTNLINGNFLSNNAGKATGSTTATISTSDKVKFIFIKNSDATDSLYLSIDGGTAAHDYANVIEVGPGESWFAKLTNTTVGNLNANNGGPNAADAGDASIQCTVAAIIDDVA